ncbi:MAG: PDZ domain-containing protein [Desulfobacteraceae bacterium]|nr:PDZ domain-containing protein [Desulfobacteraceae bacterium]
MTAKKQIGIKKLGFFLIFFILTNTVAAEEKTDPSEAVRFDREKLVIKADSTPIGEILDQIYLKCMVEILGLENREKEQITFSATGETTEDVLKRLLRYLNENNYAFEYNNVRLVKVSVLPKSRTSDSSYPDREHVEKKTKTLVRAVKVQKVVKGTQAEELELKKGDIIVGYDGIKITSARQLVSEVKKKSETDSIELVIIRDKEPLSFILRGGLIGVNINNVRVSEEELGK